MTLAVKSWWLSTEDSDDFGGEFQNYVVYECSQNLRPEKPRLQALDHKYISAYHLATTLSKKSGL